jgi:hypothetical protein
MTIKVKVVETYHVDNQNEADLLVEEAKGGNSGEFELVDYKIALKEKKAKGEVVDSYWITTLTKRYI